MISLSSAAVIHRNIGQLHRYHNFFCQRGMKNSLNTTNVLLFIMPSDVGFVRGYLAALNDAEYTEVRLLLEI